ncbi:S8 family serine peptidase [Burkholderia sp. Ax-1719]|uniref:subtilisin-like serine protease QhpE n=1 Tax=Burkholderia sp. Ax-1719 TaxID=2608334 RepID=UPI00141E510E|nr:S8 family serine peptidase [Burkholderia sp. Ax-1719]NIE65436.1 peptidase S8 and S53 subtilisin kexin sedolisin [Burkholderia sp. Ax-1719]
MNTEFRVGVVDSGYRADQAARVHAATAFVLDDDMQVHRHDAITDRLGHGSAVLERIAAGAPEARFCVAQVFRERATTTPLQIAEAIRWLVAQKVRVINLSLGVRADRTALREACAFAVDAGVVICAASPAQGAPVFPSGYPDVVRVTGDARCNATQWSWLDSAQAEFGALVRGQASTQAGASIATAALSGHAAAWLMRHPDADRDALLDWLRTHAAFIGVERRTHAS